MLLIDDDFHAPFFQDSGKTLVLSPRDGELDHGWNGGGKKMKRKAKRKIYRWIGVSGTEWNARRAVYPSCARQRWLEVLAANVLKDMAQQ